MDHKEGWAQKNWCFQTVMLEKTLESPLDNKEIKLVNPKGNQSWIFIGRTDAEAPILWPSDVNSWLTRKDHDAGKDWRQKEKEVAEDEMVGCINDSMDMSLNKLQEIVNDRGRLTCCSLWDLRVRHDLATKQQWHNYIGCRYVSSFHGWPKLGWGINKVVQYNKE